MTDPPRFYFRFGLRSFLFVVLGIGIVLALGVSGSGFYAICTFSVLMMIADWMFSPHLAHGSKLVVTFALVVMCIDLLSIGVGVSLLKPESANALLFLGLPWFLGVLFLLLLRRWLKVGWYSQIGLQLCMFCLGFANLFLLSKGS